MLTWFRWHAVQEKMAYQTFVAFRNLQLLIPFLHQNKCVNAGLLKTRTPAKNSWLTSFPLPTDEFAFLLCFVFWFIFSDMACSTSQTRQKTENSRKQHVGQERECTGRLALGVDRSNLQGLSPRRTVFVSLVKPKVNIDGRKTFP